MLRILVLIILMLVGAEACTSLRHPSVRMPIPSEAESQITAINSPAEQPAQAQTSNNENSLPVATTFTAAQALQGQPRKAMPDAYASNDRKIVSQSWQKPLGLSKTVFKMADKQLTKAFKKRPAARDGTILGLRPVLFLTRRASACCCSGTSRAFLSHWLTAPLVTPSASAIRFCCQPIFESSRARSRRPSRQFVGEFTTPVYSICGLSINAIS